MRNSNFQDVLSKRFGMFVHYGIYSEMGGLYEGREVDGIGEWIQRRLEIPVKEYESFGRKYFRPREDFAENLVKNAKKAGIKFIVLTTKHHDGFCLFKSDYTDYSTYSFFGRDICKELADECRKQGLDFGFYYSHTLDWYEKDAGGGYNCMLALPAKNRNFWDYPDENYNFENYLYGKCFPQVKELLTNYGDLKFIWFDYPHDITKEQSEELRAFVKSIQPNVLINSRIGHDCNDYESMGDNALPVAPVGADLECLVTLNDTWGYKKNDSNWKTNEETLGILCRTLGSNATLLLNVGPMGDGSLTPETENILEKMGEWTTRHKEAVYGDISGNPFPNLFSWGHVSQKGNAVYLYVTDETKDEICVNVGTDNVVKSVSALGWEDKIEYSVRDGEVKIILANLSFSVPVYKIEFEKEPVFASEIYQHGDTLSLSALWAGKVRKGDETAPAEKLVYERSAYMDNFGKNGLCTNRNCQASTWTDCKEIMCWDAYFTKAGKYKAQVINAYIDLQDDIDGDYDGNKKRGNLVLTVNDTKLPVMLDKDGELFYTSRTKLTNTKVKYYPGTVEIDKPGKYRILLERAEDGESIPFEMLQFEKTL